MLFTKIYLIIIQMTSLIIIKCLLILNALNLSNCSLTLELFFPKPQVENNVFYNCKFLNDICQNTNLIILFITVNNTMIILS